MIFTSYLLLTVSVCCLVLIRWCTVGLSELLLLETGFMRAVRLNKISKYRRYKTKATSWKRKCCRVEWWVTVDSFGQSYMKKNTKTSLLHQWLVHYKLQDDYCYLQFHACLCVNTLIRLLKAGSVVHHFAPPRGQRTLKWKEACWCVAIILLLKTEESSVR